MTDYFALLNVPRQPRLDLEALKASYHSLSAQAHPDRTTGAGDAKRQNTTDSYSQLNEAYQTLKDTKSRLCHLIFLERGSKPGDSQSLPESLMFLFSTIGPLLRQADALIKAKLNSTSALERAMTATKALPCLQQIAHARDQLLREREQLETDLILLDQSWASAEPFGKPLPELITQAEGLYHHLGFLDRWHAQLQEREFELTL